MVASASAPPVPAAGVGATPASRTRTPTLRLERRCWGAGEQVVVGIDEVGRGAWAGPVTVAALVPPPDHLRGVRDSKELTRDGREVVAARRRRFTSRRWRGTDRARSTGAPGSSWTACAGGACRRRPDVCSEHGANMASDLPDLHDRALAGTHRYVAGVGGDQWKTSSPCEGWDVRELVNHIVSGNFWAGELARGKTIDEVGDRLDGDILGDDPTAAYDESARATREAFHALG